MNQYPLWKYLLILAALLVGLIYTLPNFFGESPAVQVSPLHASLKADAALLARVTTALKAASLNPEIVMLEGNSNKARLTGEHSQPKAQSVMVTPEGQT